MITNKQAIKKHFIKTLHSFMVKKVVENTHGKYTGDDIFTLSPDGTTIMCHLPSEYFGLEAIEPTDIEIKFVAKK